MPTVFTQNRERLLAQDAVIELFNHVLQSADSNGWLSCEHFSVDGTLIQAWTSHKSLMRKDGSGKDQGGGSFKGQSRSNERHESATDTDPRLYRMGKTASELGFMGCMLSDNRHGWIASAVVTRADGYAEREAAKAMIFAAEQAMFDEQTAIPVGVDKGYDAQEFIEACLAMSVVPHAAQCTSGRLSAVPDAIAQSEGYAVSQQKKKAHRAGLWLGRNGGPDSPSHAARAYRGLTRCLC